MARWKLIEPHYLNVPGNEWEHQETVNGKIHRHRFPVPRLLDPKDPTDFNYPGEVIVCHEGQGLPNDLIFLGPPTPGMAPLDEEAEAISKKESVKWVHPIESLPGQGFSASLLNDLQRQIAELTANQPAKPSAPVPTNMVPREDFEKLQEQVAALLAKQAEPPVQARR